MDATPDKSLIAHWLTVGSRFPQGWLPDGHRPKMPVGRPFSGLPTFLAQYPVPRGGHLGLRFRELRYRLRRSLCQSSFAACLHICGRPSC